MNALAELVDLVKPYFAICGNGLVPSQKLVRSLENLYDSGNLRLIFSVSLSISMSFIHTLVESQVCVCVCVCVA